MASSSFNFDDLDTVVDVVLSAQTSNASLPPGESLTFDAFVDVSLPYSTGGGEMMLLCMKMMKPGYQKKE